MKISGYTSYIKNSESIRPMNSSEGKSLENLKSHHPNHSDRVEMSKTSRDLKLAMDVVYNTLDIRIDKVNPIKTQIANLSGVLKLQQTWRDESVGFYSASSSSNILDL